MSLPRTTAARPPLRNRHRLLLVGAVYLALLSPGAALAVRPALATPQVVDGAAERQAILQAQQAIAREFGGHKISQHWRKERLLIVWRTAGGKRVLVRVNPGNGRWQVVRRENPDR